MVHKFELKFWASEVRLFTLEFGGARCDPFQKGPEKKLKNILIIIQLIFNTIYLFLSYAYTTKKQAVFIFLIS